MHITASNRLSAIQLNKWFRHILDVGKANRVLLPILTVTYVDADIIEAVKMVDLVDFNANNDGILFQIDSDPSWLVVSSVTAALVQNTISASSEPDRVKLIRIPQ